MINILVAGVIGAVASTAVLVTGVNVVAPSAPSEPVSNDQLYSYVDQ
jgi:hypothetical protein